MKERDNPSEKLRDKAESVHLRSINGQLLIGWLIIVVVLLVTYSIEVAKGDRTLTYILIFAPILVLPLLGAFIIYMYKSDWKGLCYVIVAGYFVMYIFVMITGSTPMVFTYILPLLSLLILYHHPNLILCTGLASVLLNVISLILNIYDITYFGSQAHISMKEAEIQLALLILCFGGCYLASRLYNKISRQNYDYIAALDDKTEQVRNMSLQTIVTITNILDAKDPYTEGHSERVAVYTKQLALALGLSEEEATNMGKVALMHDIGKIGVPDRLLNKTDRLDKEEYEQMKQHAIVGGEIVGHISTVPGIYEGVRYHHERYDGKGYPEGLKGENIPYIARVIAVADTYDAMTSNRVYRKHLAEDTALAELERGAGTQFDPVIANKMVELLKSGAIVNLCTDRPEKDEPPTAEEHPAEERPAEERQSEIAAAEEERPAEERQSEIATADELEK